MLFFNTEFDIYPNSQSPDFKPDTVSQSPDFKPDIVSQSPGFKPDTVSQSPGFKPGTVSQSPGFKPGTDAIHLPYFHTQAFKKKKKIKTTNNLIIKELRNPHSLSLIEIRRSEVKSLSGPLQKKTFCLLLFTFYFFGKNKYKKDHTLLLI